MVIYIDVLMITNFVISYFLLIAASIVSGYTYNRKRIVFSAATGAVCCLYILADINNLFFNLAFKIISLIICAVIAFGFSAKKKLMIQGLWYMFLNMLLTGLIGVAADSSTEIYQQNLFYYLNINPLLLVVSSVVIYIFILIFAIIKEKISPMTLYTADIIFKEFALENIKLFYDSGFKLKDIVSNNDVVIVSFEKTKANLPERIQNNVNRFLSEEYQFVDCKFIPVFFNTIQGEGIVPAIKAEYMIIENKKIENILIAFVKNNLSENVTGMFGNDIKKQL